MSSRRLRAVVVSGCAALMLSACTSGGADGTAVEEPPEPAVTAPDGATTGQDDAAATEEPTAEAEAEASETASAEEASQEPLAAVAVPIGFVEGGELEVAVTGLDVTGELLRLALTFTASLPPGTEEVAIGAVLTGTESAPAAGISPELIDPVNLKAYEAVAGLIPNGTSVYVVDGVPQTLVMYYAAPQDPVETFDIALSSQVPAIVDVPFEP